MEDNINNLKMVKLQVWTELTLEYSRQGYLSKYLFGIFFIIVWQPICLKLKRDSPVHVGNVKTDPSRFRPIPISIISNEM